MDAMYNNSLRETGERDPNDRCDLAVSYVGDLAVESGDFAGDFAVESAGEFAVLQSLKRGRQELKSAGNKSE